MATWGASPVQSSATVDVGLPSTPVAGNLLVAFVQDIGASTAPTSVKDAAGNSYTLLGSWEPNTTQGVGIYGMICPASPGINQKTVVTTGLTTPHYAMQEWAGAPGTITGIVDKSAVAQGTGSGDTGAAPAMAATTVPTDLVLTFVGCRVTSGTGYTASGATLGPNTGNFGAAAYQVESSTGTYTPSVGWTTSRAFAATTVSLIPGSPAFTGTATGSFVLTSANSSQTPKLTQSLPSMGVFDLQGLITTPTPALSAGVASGSFSLFGGDNLVPARAIGTAEPGRMSVPFLPGAPYQQVTAPNPAASGSFVLGSTATGGAGLSSTGSASFSLAAGTPAGTPAPVQSGATGAFVLTGVTQGGILLLGSFVLTANAPIGKPSVTAAPASASFVLAAGPLSGVNTLAAAFSLAGATIGSPQARGVAQAAFDLESTTLAYGLATGTFNVAGLATASGVTVDQGVAAGLFSLVAFGNVNKSSFGFFDLAAPPVNGVHYEQPRTAIMRSVVDAAEWIITEADGNAYTIVTGEVP